MLTKITQLLNFRRTTVSAIAAAALTAAYDSYKTGKIDWTLVALAGLTTLAGMGRSTIHKRIKI